jgi:hypothetical protein
LWKRGERIVFGRMIVHKRTESLRIVKNTRGIGLALVVMMTVSVLALPKTSEPEPFLGSGWNIEIVDSDGDVGREVTSIALDSNDNPHISYHDGTNDDLKYAKWDGNGWNIETVDSAGVVGWFTSMALDSNDYPHISYYDRTNDDLKYAKWDGSGWNNETVDSAGRVGWFTSLALDSNDDPHISYHDWINDDVKYWNIEIVDSAGDVGRHTSIALDGSDYAHISYYDGTNDDLKYAMWTGIAWNIEIVDSAGDVGLYPSLALDSNDDPHISYLDLTNDDLKYAKWDGSGWNNETVDSAGDVGWYSSLVLDSNDDPHVSYDDWANSDLKYATKAELAPATRSITLDIDPDTLNLKSKGRWITAYLTTENAYADDIDTLSLLLNDVIRPEWWDIQNNTTLMIKFDRAAVQAIVPVSDSVDIKVTGQWTNGESFEVHDMIRVINPGQ